MVKRMILPSEALDDVCTLLRLSSEQLKALDELFTKGESASPLRAEFVNRVAESLQVNIEDARSVVMVCSFLLRRSEAKDDEDFVTDLLVDFREFLENSLPDDERQTVLAKFDGNREIFKSLATPKPAPLRVEKIRRLQSGPEQHIHSFRTVCQLRPLFEGPENDERIVGLVPMILLEIECADADGDCSTLAFSMDDEDLAELERVVKRTRAKLEAISEKYESEILTAD